MQRTLAPFAPNDQHNDRNHDPKNWFPKGNAKEANDEPFDEGKYSPDHPQPSISFAIRSRGIIPQVLGT